MPSFDSYPELEEAWEAGLLTEAEYRREKIRLNRTEGGRAR